jgi:hypothetical protein
MDIEISAHNSSLVVSIICIQGGVSPVLFSQINYQEWDRCLHIIKFGSESGLCDLTKELRATYDSKSLAMFQLQRMTSTLWEGDTTAGPS